MTSRERSTLPKTPALPGGDVVPKHKVEQMRGLRDSFQEFPGRGVCVG